MRRAESSGVLHPTAMTLSTASSSGVVSARTVILKGLDADRLVFESENYSRKGVEIGENPHVAATLYWREVDRQICVTGMASALDDTVSDTMWAARGRPNQAASSVAREGEPLDSLAAEADLCARADGLVKAGTPIHRPTSYRAYGLVPVTLELWEGSADRLHRRVFYARTSPGAPWAWRRIQP
ncbi:MAG: pyridoxine/pyridoxamine 5'-phosphate oxidase [Acidimicrobiales bacterium]